MWDMAENGRNTGHGGIAKRGRVLAVLGSPRRDGNSDVLAAEFLRGAAAAGYEPAYIIPTDLGMSPCDGMNQCFKTGKCVILDGMNEAYEEVLGATHILIATPVYFMGPPGSLKSFIDRFQAVWARFEILGEPKPDAAGRKGFAIVVGATPGEGKMYRPTVSIIKAFLNVTGFTYAGEIIATGLDEKVEAGERKDLLARAFEAGREFVTR
jgi:multimeric flavodoxin WrbA